MTPKERAAMQQALIYLDAIINGEGVKPYQLEGTAFTLREALDHSGEANEMVGCAYCNNPLFAGTKCNNCGFITLAEQAEPNSTFMEGYRIGLAEMREKCAKVCDKEMDDWDYQSVVNVALNNCAAFIRAIKFEGDTGFRPVSEMVAEHKQDPKKAAAIEKAKVRKAEQEPVAWMDLHKELGQLRWAGKDIGWDLAIDAVRNRLEELYAAPVRTKDLTDDEVTAIACETYGDTSVPEVAQIRIEFARAVIAADREKNRG